jgi:AraC-like DNA-binding protein
MHKAIEMIRENRLTTAEIASLVGYESEAGFSKAFIAVFRCMRPSWCACALAGKASRVSPVDG